MLFTEEKGHRVPIRNYHRHHRNRTFCHRGTRSITELPDLGGSRADCYRNHCVLVAIYSWTKINQKRTGGVISPPVPLFKGLRLNYVAHPDTGCAGRSGLRARAQEHV